MNSKKKKIYEIVWEGIYTSLIQISRVSLIVAKNKEQAIKKFYRKYNHFVPSIISFREYKEVLGNET